MKKLHWYNKIAQMIKLLSSLSSRVTFNASQMQRASSCLTESKAVSLDKWHPRVLKELTDVITGLSEQEESGNRDMETAKDWRWANEFQIFPTQQKSDLWIWALVKFNAELQQNARMVDKSGFVHIYFKKWWLLGTLLSSLKPELTPANLVPCCTGLEEQENSIASNDIF